MGLGFLHPFPAGKAVQGKKDTKRMDDFSFPTLATDQDSAPCQLPFPHFASSPLWFHSSSVAARDAETKRLVEKDAETNQESEEGSAADEPAVNDGSEDRLPDDEERMDMLWEDFNEELCQKSRDQKRATVKGAKRDAASEAESDAEQHGMVELCCVRALGVPKGAGSMIHHTRPSLLVMLKVLKRLFLIQKAGSTKRESLC